jgi:hypothetical protein
MNTLPTETDWLFDRLAEHTRVFTDELGTRYVWLEGGFGGSTVLVWLPSEGLPTALQLLQPLRFKGRVVLAVHAQDGGSLERAVFWTDPQRLLLVDSALTAPAGLASQAVGLVGFEAQLKWALQSWNLVEE